MTPTLIKQVVSWAADVGFDPTGARRWMIAIVLDGERDAKLEVNVRFDSYRVSFEHKGKGSYFKCDGGTPWAQRALDKWKLGERTAADIVEMRGFRLVALGKLIDRLERAHDVRFDRVHARVKASGAPAGTKERVERWVASLAAPQRRAGVRDA